MKDRQLVQYLPLLGSMLVFLLFRHYFQHQVGDDSYIYFRYVDRAVAGEWWSWTNHIPPVEGYSSPLWYLLLVFSGKAGLPVIATVQLWGNVFAMLALSGTWMLARELKARPWLAGMACLFLSTSHGFHYWATSGLETSLYAALLVWSALGIVRERHWWLPTAMLGLARPEGVFLLLGILVSMLVVKRRQFSTASVISCIIPTLGWLAVRLSVYGEPLPNTFYAKATGEPMGQVIRGMLYCLPLLLPLLAGWFIWWRDRSQAVMVVLGMASMLLGIVLLGGGDWMFHFRLLVPLYALVLTVLAVQWQSAGLSQKAVLLASAVPMLLLSVPPAYWWPALQGKQLPLAHYQEGNMTHVSVALAGILAERYPAPQLIAVNHAGALPWALPDHDVIDMVGLNDAHIARAEGRLHHKYDVDYVLGLKPGLVILNSRIRPGTDGVWYHKGYWAGEDALVDNPVFQRDYQPTDLVMAWNWHVPWPYSLIVKDAETSWILVYERKQRPGSAVE